MTGKESKDFHLFMEPCIDNPMLSSVDHDGTPSLSHDP